MLASAEAGACRRRARHRGPRCAGGRARAAAPRRAPRPPVPRLPAAPELPRRRRAAGDVLLRALRALAPAGPHGRRRRRPPRRLCGRRGTGRRMRRRPRLRARPVQLPRARLQRAAARARRCAPQPEGPRRHDGARGVPPERRDDRQLALPARRHAPRRHRRDDDPRRRARRPRPPRRPAREAERRGRGAARPRRDAGDAGARRGRDALPRGLAVATTAAGTDTAALVRDLERDGFRVFWIDVARRTTVPVEQADLGRHGHLYCVRR
jgi:hypothetical protein